MPSDIRGTARDIIFELAGVDAHPEFQSILREIGAAETGRERVDRLMRLMTTRELLRRGVPLPEGANIQIEASTKRTIDDLNDPTPPSTVEVSFDVCVFVPADFVAVQKCVTITIDIDIDVDID